MKPKELWVKAAVKLANEIKPDVILLLTDNVEEYELLSREKLNAPLIVSTTSKNVSSSVKNSLTLIAHSPSLKSDVEHSLALAMNKRRVKEGDIALCLSFDKGCFNLYLCKVSKESLRDTIYEFIRKTKIKPKVFEAVLNIALEIGREGREGRLIGTAFLIGDSDKVLKNSRQMILNPFKGHRKKERMITNSEIKETIKELAQLEGVFVLSGDGILRAAGRFLNVDTSSIDIPHGLGTRHVVVAAMTSISNAVGITVSQSGGIVRIFHKGKIVFTIDPQRRTFLSS